MNILVIGVTGYISPHTLVERLQPDYYIVVLDNLVNGSRDMLRRVVVITGKTEDLIQGEVLNRLFAEHDVEAVSHFDDFKALLAMPLVVFGRILLSLKAKRTQALCFMLLEAES
ncbi:hypothetical protein BOX17_14775 [Halomonas aestuarii]|uniref:NAD-dependent epimerase/dehydratase domain-containing protein n=1 Tax=Halomonas aestuarii TaxID=1897729 RepID=A0A1J0VJB0_9GAMM|nr:NAD-dependent epimerase/dehydratase family protein [Halomonas aestuarii]APE32103.1 hypothetical protein BOX17_14775 [Halomonas aestuarii]